MQERVRRKYDELDAEKGTVEGEWRQYKDAFIGMADELCGRTSVKEVHREAETKDGGRKRGRRQWGENREAWEMIEGIRDRGEQPSTTLITYMYGQKKEESGGQITEEYGGRNVPTA